MKTSFRSIMMSGAMLVCLSMCFTSCEGTLDDIFGEWSRPTGNNGNTKTTIAVKSVTLDQTTLTKAVGDDAVTLTATVDPSDASDKTVTWKSSDESVVTVVDGVVTIVAAGTATITATATNGTDDTADDKTATCEVTISAKKVNVESVKLDQTTLTQTAGDAAVTLTATVTPDDATDKTVKWTSSNESVATVADGVVTFVAAGTATITATAPNGTDDTADDKTAECAVTVNAVAAKVTTAPTATTGTIAAGSTTALVTAGAADGGTMMYQATTTNTKPTSTTGFSATVPTAEGRAAGTYYVWYYAKADATHVDSEISATGIAVTITAKPSATVTTVPMATTGTIAAGSTTALVTAGVADGGTMMYQATTTNTKPTSTTGFSETVPTAEGRAAATYYVWYYAKADATHVDSEISASAVAVTVTDVYAANEYKEGLWDGTKVVFTKQTASSATVVADAASAVTWSAGWYTVTGDVTITGNVTLGADTHLILQDGAKLTIKGKLDCRTNSSNLYIYGQNKGDGKLIVSGNNDGKGIDCNNANIEIHGGDITVQSKSSIGINPKGFKMYGGKLTATSSSTGENAIVFYAGHFEVYGGEVEATSNKTNLSGIVAGNTEYILKVFGGKVKGIGGASGKGFNCKLLSGTTDIKFYFSDNGSTWDAGTSYSTATDAQNKRYAKAE